MRKLVTVPATLAMFGFLVGCASQVPYDYSNFRAHPPRSILVLPPTNNTPDVNGTYGYLTTMTRPLAEKGYYVFPVMLVDQYMKENGLPSANEMQNVPLPKIQEIIGADSVLYMTLTQYGTKYELINSATEVGATGKLVDVRTGLQLWDGKVYFVQNSNSGAGGGNPLASLIAAAVVALVDQIISTSVDHAHEVSKIANVQLFMDKDRGLLDGPYIVPK